MHYHIWVGGLGNLRLDMQIDVPCVCEATQAEKMYILTTVRQLCIKGFANLGVYCSVETSGADIAGSVAFYY
jgi:hypothetical protein